MQVQRGLCAATADAQQQRRRHSSSSASETGMRWRSFGQTRTELELLWACGFRPSVRGQRATSLAAASPLLAFAATAGERQGGISNLTATKQTGSRELRGQGRPRRSSSKEGRVSGQLLA